MAQEPRQLTAEEPSEDNKDESLPDPSRTAKIVLWVLVLVAVGAAAVMNSQGWTGKPFTPSATTTANFSLFATFYVAAQVIERLMQLIAPLVVLWTPWPATTRSTTTADGTTTTITTDPSDAVKAAHVKADRSAVMMGIASVAGVVASCAFGLYFLAAVGIDTTNTIDAFCTGITIGAGTKPLHDLITLIQNQNTPTTGTGST
jgi:hypothetical protein